MTDNVTNSMLEEPQEIAAPPLASAHSRQNTPAGIVLPEDTQVVIWTPDFIVIFALLLVTGLSIASILTQGWLNGLYSSTKILLTYAVLILGTWFAVLIKARSLWVRVGAGFSCIWALFNICTVGLGLFSINPHASLIVHLNAATNTALLAAYLCLSLARTPLRHWDHWFYRLAPIIAGMSIVAIYLFTPGGRSLSLLESTYAAMALYLGIATWWLRPSCWRQQPGPAFLFGIAPVVLLLLSNSGGVNRANNFFFSQIILLCFLLAALRVLQCELRH